MLQSLEGSGLCYFKEIPKEIWTDEDKKRYKTLPREAQVQMLERFAYLENEFKVRAQWAVMNEVFDIKKKGGLENSRYATPGQAAKIRASSTDKKPVTKLQTTPEPAQVAVEQVEPVKSKLSPRAPSFNPAGTFSNPPSRESSADATKVRAVNQSNQAATGSKEVTTQSITGQTAAATNSSANANKELLENVITSNMSATKLQEYSEVKSESPQPKSHKSGSTEGILANSTSSEPKTSDPESPKIESPDAKSSNLKSPKTDSIESKVPSCGGRTWTAEEIKRQNDFMEKWGSHSQKPSTQRKGAAKKSASPLQIAEIVPEGATEIQLTQSESESQASEEKKVHARVKIDESAKSTCAKILSPAVSTAPKSNTSHSTAAQTDAEHRRSQSPRLPSQTPDSSPNSTQVLIPQYWLKYLELEDVGSLMPSSAVEKSSPKVVDISDKNISNSSSGNDSPNSGDIHCTGDSYSCGKASDGQKLDTHNASHLRTISQTELSSPSPNTGAPPSGNNPEDTTASSKDVLNGENSQTSRTSEDIIRSEETCSHPQPNVAQQSPSSEDGWDMIPVHMRKYMEGYTETSSKQANSPVSPANAKVSKALSKTVAASAPDVASRISGDINRSEELRSEQKLDQTQLQTPSKPVIARKHIEESTQEKTSSQPHQTSSTTSSVEIVVGEFTGNATKFTKSKTSRTSSPSKLPAPRATPSIVAELSPETEAILAEVRAKDLAVKENLKNAREKAATNGMESSSNGPPSKPQSGKPNSKQSDDDSQSSYPEWLRNIPPPVHFYEQPGYNGPHPNEMVDALIRSTVAKTEARWKQRETNHEQSETDQAEKANAFGSASAPHKQQNGGFTYLQNYSPERLAYLCQFLEDDSTTGAEEEKQTREPADQRVSRKIKPSCQVSAIEQVVVASESCHQEQAIKEAKTPLTFSKVTVDHEKFGGRDHQLESSSPEPRVQDQSVKGSKYQLGFSAITVEFDKEPATGKAAQLNIVPATVDADNKPDVHEKTQLGFGAITIDYEKKPLKVENAEAPVVDTNIFACDRQTNDEVHASQLYFDNAAFFKHHGLSAEEGEDLKARLEELRLRDRGRPLCDKIEIPQEYAELDEVQRNFVLFSYDRTKVKGAVPYGKERDTPQPRTTGWIEAPKSSKDLRRKILADPFSVWKKKMVMNHGIRRVSCEPKTELVQQFMRAGEKMPDPAHICHNPSDGSSLISVHTSEAGLEEKDKKYPDHKRPEPICQMWEYLLKVPAPTREDPSATKWHIKKGEIDRDVADDEWDKNQLGCTLSLPTQSAVRFLNRWLREQVKLALKDPMLLDINDKGYFSGRVSVCGLTCLLSGVPRDMLHWPEDPPNFGEIEWDHIDQVGIEFEEDPFRHIPEEERATARSKTAETAVNAHIAEQMLKREDAARRAASYRDAAKYTLSRRVNENPDFFGPVQDHDNPYLPRAGIYLRPAREEDMELITEIYNDYSMNTIHAPHLNPVTRDFFRTRLNDCEERQLPFLVACSMKNKLKNRRRKIAGPQVYRERVVGFIYAKPFRPDEEAFEGTVELSIYVDRACQQHGIGKNLLDRALPSLDSGWFCHVATDFYNENTPRHELINGGNGKTRKIIISVFYDSHSEPECKSLVWRTKFLQGFGFEPYGNFFNVAAKNFERARGQGFYTP